MRRHFVTSPESVLTPVSFEGRNPWSEGQETRLDRVVLSAVEGRGFDNLESPTASWWATHQDKAKEPPTPVSKLLHSGLSVQGFRPTVSLRNRNRGNNPLILWLFVLLLLALAANDLQAQSNTRLRGLVIDQQDGAPIAGAVVQLEGTSYQVAADDRGNFAFDNIPLGVYRLRVTAPGYQVGGLIEIDLVVDVTRHVRVTLERKIYPVRGITVSASRPKLHGDVTIIDRQQIEDSRPSDLPELLESVEGVQVERTGPGGPTRIRIRGCAPKQVLVLMDGHKINPSGSGEADLSSVPVEMVQRIELYKSGASAQFGPGAIGGVVNIITQPITLQEPSFAETENQLGQWDTRRHVITLVNPLRLDKETYRIAYSANSSDGDFDYDYHISPDGTVYQGTRINNRSKSRNYFLSGLWTPDRIRVSYSLQIYESENGLPGSASEPILHALREDDRVLAGLTLQRSFSSRLKARFTGGLSRYEQRFRDLNAMSTYQFDTRFTNDILDVRADIECRLLKHNLLEWGAQYQRDVLNHVDYLRELNGSGKTVRRTYSAFVLDRHPFDLSWTKLLDDVTLSAALRYDNATTTPEKTAPRYPWEKPRQEVRTESWSPRFGVTVSRGERLRFVARAAWGESLRLPSINALFWKGDARSEGNPDLRPERSRHLDGGIELTGRTEQFKFSAGVTVYRKNVEDLVEWVRSGPQGVFKPVNLGAARITGHEDFITLKLWKERLVISYGNSITHALNKQPGHNSYDMWLTYSPRYVTTLGIRLNHRLAFASYRVRRVARRYALSGNEKWYDGYTLQEVGLGTQVHLTSRWRLQLDGRLRNAGDEEYVLISKHPMSGQEYSLGMKLTFTPKERKK